MAVTYSMSADLSVTLNLETSATSSLSGLTSKGSTNFSHTGNYAVGSTVSTSGADTTNAVLGFKVTGIDGTEVVVIDLYDGTVTSTGASSTVTRIGAGGSGTDAAGTAISAITKAKILLIKNTGGARGSDAASLDITTANASSPDALKAGSADSRLAVLGANGMILWDFGSEGTENGSLIADSTGHLVTITGSDASPTTTTSAEIYIVGQGTAANTLLEATS